MGNIGNKSGETYNLVCILCGGMRWLRQIAHRDAGGHVTGCVFVCFECAAKIETGDYSYSIQGRESG